MIKLNDGTFIPQLGYGLWQVKDEDVEKLVSEAFRIGYRSIDSAQIYGNEEGLGRAIKASNLSRSEMYITTKIWNAEQGHASTLKSFEVSMKKLRLDHLDLLLIHWPAPKKNLYTETWKALIELKNSGRVKSIGVSNFNIDHLERIIDATGVIPSINQIEVHPYFQRHDLREYHDKMGIKTEAWSPLGQGHVIDDPAIASIGKKHHKSSAQIILRWHMESGLIAIPKTTTVSRIKENFDIFDFKLDSEDMQKIAKLNKVEGRIGPDPMTATF